MAAENFEWACFQAQQAAEKALKAFLRLKGYRNLISHSVFALLRQCQEIEPEFAKVEDVRELDQYYLPTRYPDGLPHGVPHLFYRKENAQRCQSLAESVIELVAKLAKT